MIRGVDLVPERAGPRVGHRSALASGFERRAQPAPKRAWLAGARGLAAGLLCSAAIGCAPSDASAPDGEVALPADREVSPGAGGVLDKGFGMPGAVPLGSIGGSGASPFAHYDPEFLARLQEFLQAAKAAPEDPEPQAALGRLHEAYGSHAVALKSYAEALGLAADAAWTGEPLARLHYGYGRCALEAGDDDRAQRAFAASIEAFGDYAPAHWQLGLIELERGSAGALTRARRAFERAVEIAPQDVSGYVGRARVALAAGTAAAALEALEELRSRSPAAREDGLVERLRQRALFQLDRRDEALAASAFTDRPTSAWRDPWSDGLEPLRAGAQLASVRALLRTGQPGLAWRQLGPILEARRDDATVLGLATKALVALERFEDALALVVDAQRRGLGYPELALNQAVCLERLERRAEALSALDALRAEHPDWVPQYEVLGRIRLAAGDAEGAIAAFERLDELGAEPSFERLLEHARACGLLGRWEAALEPLKTAQKRFPAKHSQHVFAASALMELGRLDEAAYQLERLAAKEPDPRALGAVARGACASEVGRMRPWRATGFAVALACACAPESGSDTETDRAAASADDERAWLFECAAERRLEFVYRSGAAGGLRMPEIMGGGVALVDLERDGDLDVYFVQGGEFGEGASEAGEAATNQLFENDGGARFVETTEGSGAAHRGYGMGAAVGDVDGDGYDDVYVTNFGPDALFRSLGDGSFEDATARVDGGHPGWGASATFFDADRDGALDLYVTTYLNWSERTELPCRNRLGARDYCSPRNYENPARDALYQNVGERLHEIGAESGIASLPGTGLGVVAGDFDDDGWCDVFVANDGMPDRLWRNLGASELRFQNVGDEAGCAVDVNGTHKAGMGVVTIDVDGDGDLDLAVCNLNRESDSFYENRGGWFSDRTAIAGLASASKRFTRFGMGWVDFDHDGRIDLFQANGRVQAQAERWREDDAYAEPNMLWRGRAEGGFASLGPGRGIEPAQIATSRAAAFGDLDGDGACDIVVVNRDGPAALLLNRSPRESGLALLLDVRERGGSTALGARLTIRVEGAAGAVHRDVRSGYSYLAANDPRVHVVLPRAAARLLELQVRWSDGALERFEGPALVAPKGAVVRVERGKGTTIDER